MKHRVGWYFVAANAIGLLFLWLAARDLPFGEIVPYLRGADLSRLAFWSLLFLLLYGVCHAARVLRWEFLVRPIGDVERRPVDRAAALGFAAIVLLPLRLGELVRPYLLARRSDLSTSSLLATAVVERVIDGLFVTGLLFVTLATYSGGASTGFATMTGLIAAAIFVPALLICGLALWRREWTLWVVESLARPFSTSLAERGAELLDTFIDGFLALAHRGILGRFLVVTAIYWGTNVVSLWLLARYGFGLAIDPWNAVTVVAILVVGIMIPAGPALTGNFEYFVSKGMGLFVALEVVGARVAVFAALLHVLQFIVIVAPGFWVMWTDPAARHLIEISERAREELD
ncbi:MAG: lysylphosphatidylglycerol synthase transmembrane domain-containing protein [Bradymonadaceae bacterium]